MKSCKVLGASAVRRTNQPGFLPGQRGLAVFMRAMTSAFTPGIDARPEERYHQGYMDASEVALVYITMIKHIALRIKGCSAAFEFNSTWWQTVIGKLWASIDEYQSKRELWYRVSSAQPRPARPY